MAEAKLCAVEGCGKAACRKTYCNKHYLRWWKYGDPLVCKNEIGKYGAACRVDGCGQKHHAHGFCADHAFRFRSHGDPLAGGPQRSRKGALQAWLSEHAKHEGSSCLIWPFGRTAGGYGEVYWEGRQSLAHRVMCELAHGAPPDTADVVAHSCGKGHEGCVNPRHLRWATYGENVSDQIEHGTISRGEDRPAAKLTEAGVREIRALRGRMRQVDIANIFGVSQAVVSKVQLRLAWSWVE
jgi:hypothetical protein